MTLEHIIEASNCVLKKREKILELQKQIDELKNDPDLTSSVKYLRVAKNEGYIDDSPGFRNGYKMPTKYRGKDGNVLELNIRSIDKTEKL